MKKNVKETAVYVGRTYRGVGGRELIAPSYPIKSLINLKNDKVLILCRGWRECFILTGDSALWRESPHCFELLFGGATLSLSS